MVNIGINGFGRIGRNVMRASLNHPDINVVAINDTGSPELLAHLLKFDTTHGTFDAVVEAGEGALIVNGQEIKLFGDRNPANLPWGDYGVDIVVEATGKLKERHLAAGHLVSGVKKVILASPGKDEDITIVLGVNEEEYDPQRHTIISNASCSTNCLAPFAKVINDKFGIEKGIMTAVHSFTNDQRTLDHKHKDLRRARTASANIIPTSTGAAKAVGKVLPELNGRLNGISMRVPVPNVSVISLVADLKKKATAEEINAVLKDAAEGHLQGIMAYSELPLVSSDYLGDPHSSTIDALSTMVVDDDMVQIVSWYDNEWGYSNRVLDLCSYVHAKGYPTE
jgi:glyceraldehyde 3-phosphate dehydrogenase